MEENRTMTPAQRAALAEAREAEAQRRKYAANTPYGTQNAVRQQPRSAQAPQRQAANAVAPQRRGSATMQRPSSGAEAAQKINTREYPKVKGNANTARPVRPVNTKPNTAAKVDEDKADTGEFPSYVRTGKGGYHPPKSQKRVVARQHRRKLDPKFKAALLAVATVLLIIIILLVAGVRYSTYRLPENRGEIRFFGIVRGGVPTSGWISSSDGTTGKLKSGKIEYSDGSVYEGGLFNVMRSGEGTITYANGDVYSGVFSENELNGKGTVVYAKGNTYEGNFVNGKKDGYGVHVYKNSDGIDIYEGEFANDKRNGKGKMTYASGDIYEGEFKDDLKHGKGVYLHEDGRSFEGTYENNLRKEGLFKFSNKASFEGTFEMNPTNQMLEGTYTYSNGSTITGRYDKATNTFIAY